MDIILFAYLIGGLFGSLIIIYVLLAQIIFRPKMNSKVENLAEAAWNCAAKITGLPKKGSTPKVDLKSDKWNGNVIGNYKWFKLFLKFGPVIWDRILVTSNPRYPIFSNLVHEMTHAIRRRNGKSSTEVASEEAERLANEVCGGPEVDELVRKFYE